MAICFPQDEVDVRFSYLPLTIPVMAIGSDSQACSSLKSDWLKGTFAHLDHGLMASPKTIMAE
jgi:hypothetical protein